MSEDLIKPSLYFLEAGGKSASVSAQTFVIKILNKMNPLVEPCVFNANSFSVFCYVSLQKLKVKRAGKVWNEFVLIHIFHTLCLYLIFLLYIQCLNAIPWSHVTGHAKFVWDGCYVWRTAHLQKCIISVQNQHFNFTLIWK